jgi:spermidine synthase
VKDFYIYCVVVVGGAVVLTLELLGTRILGPFYGVSLFLWSVLIAITLLSLSIGYTIGGRLADRYPSFHRLTSLIGIAGIWIVLIPWIRHPLLVATEPLGLRPAVFIASFVLFSPPLILLGTIIPYAIKIKTNNLDQLGKTAGDLYALSTFSSVIAALATSSFLIPYVGVSRLTLIIGLILIVLAIAGYMLNKKNKLIAVMLPFFLVSSWGISKPPDESPAPERGLLAIEQSRYAELRVIDEQDARHLTLDGSAHALVDIRKWESHYPYVSLMDMPKYIHAKPGKMLLIGLGAGSLVKNYASEGWKVDAVEIDPAVVAIAKQFFSLQDEEATIYTMDGRQFLNMSKDKYDVILLDAFGSGSIPFHLVTSEVFQLMKSHLLDNGILAVNVDALGWHDIIVRSVAATLHTSFSNTIALPVAEPPSEVGNVVLLASDRPLTLEREIIRDYTNLDFRFSNNYWKVHGWDNLFEPEITNAPVLTDDLNPIDVWSEDVNYAARLDWHGYFSDNKLSW